MIKTRCNNAGCSRDPPLSKEAKFFIIKRLDDGKGGKSNLSPLLIKKVIDNAEREFCQKLQSG